MSTPTDQDLKAANYLEASLAMFEDGKHWIKGDYNRRMPDGEFGFCSIGAMSWQPTRAEVPLEARLRATRTLAGMIPGEYTSSAGARNTIIRFNDSKTTTYDDVRQVFSRAIAKLRGGTS